MIEIAFFFCNPLHFGNLYNYSLDFIYTKSTSVVEFELGWSGRNIQNRAKSKYISFKS